MNTRHSAIGLRILWSALAGAASLSLPFPSLADTERISVDSNEAQGNDESGAGAINESGRFVAFSSVASNLVAGDTPVGDVLVRDRLNGSTERVSVDSGEIAGNGASSDPAISADGNVVAFQSAATNLVPGDTNGKEDIFVRNRLNGTTERVSVDTDEVQADGDSFQAAISADGRYVAFVSAATNLVSGDTNGTFDVFVRDLLDGTTERVSVDSGELQSSGNSFLPAVSADGHYVAFYSDSTNLASADTDALLDVFVRDRFGGTTELISVDTNEAKGNSNSVEASISADGQLVTFSSTATNLVPGDMNDVTDVFARNRATGTTERISVSSAELEANGPSFLSAVSASGRFVAFTSFANTLVDGDVSLKVDVFVRDRLNGTTERISLDSAGVEGNGDSFEPSISADGSVVAFTSDATNLVSGDTNSTTDVFAQSALQTCFGKTPTLTGSGTLVGTPGDDVIAGSPDADTIDGRGGNDLICGLGGDDRLSGGSGSDQLSGGPGADVIHGDSGNDRIEAGDGDDELHGDSGNDALDAGAGDDELDGGSGNDAMSGGDGNDVLLGDSGNDAIDAGSGSDIVKADSGNDAISTGDGDDCIDAGSGSDQIQCGAGQDKVDTGSGFDQVNGCEAVDPPHFQCAAPAPPPPPPPPAS